MKDLHQHIHDIRRPLNGISLQAELVKMLAQSSDSLNNETSTSETTPKIEAAADKIIQNSKAVSELLQVLYEDMSEQMKQAAKSSKSDT